MHAFIHMYMCNVCIDVHRYTHICPCMPPYAHVYIYADVHTHVCMVVCNVYVWYIHIIHVSQDEQ